MKLTTEKLEQAKEQAPGRVRRWKGWQLDGLALLLFVALTIFMTWPVAPNMHRSLEQWGDALLQTWTLDWVAHAFATNPAQWADANAFYPYANTLAFSETLVGQALLVAPVIWLTGNPVLGYNLLLLSSFVLCGWGMYLLAKDLTGSRVAGLAAGMIFAFFPHRFGQMSHLHLLTAQWMPFCLLFLRRYLVESRTHRATLRAESKAKPTGQPFGPKLTTTEGMKIPSSFIPLFLFGFFLALQLLSSTYLGLFLVITVGLYLLYHAIIGLWRSRLGQTDWLRASRDIPNARKSNSILSSLNFRAFLNKTLPLGVVLVVTALVVLPFYWPYLQVQQDLGFERSASEVQSFSAQPFYYLDVAKENKLNQWLYGPLFQQGWWQSSAGGERGLWLGLLAMGLGAVGSVVALTRRKVERDGLFYLILLVLAVSFTFGPGWQTGRFGTVPLPYALLYNYVPGFGAIRVPVRFIYVVALALAVLAGWGVWWLQQRLRLTQSWKAGLFGLTLVVLLAGEYWSDVAQVESDVLRRPAPAAAQWLDAQPQPATALHVPLSGSDSTNLFLQYWTRASWRPVMNGFSGFMPPAYDALKVTVVREGFSPRVLELLQGLEVRYLVIEADHATVKPQWPALKADLAKAGSTLVAEFGSTLIYELKADPWLTRLKEAGVQPDSAVYFVEYRRDKPPLLELTASYLQRQSVVRRENMYGSISVGFRPLPSLPAGRAADFLVLPTGEDPTLYGFHLADKAFGNNLLTLYRRNPDLVARYDFMQQAASEMLNRTKPLALRAEGNTLRFGESNGNATASSVQQYVSLGLAVLQPSKLTIETGGENQIIELEPGLSVYKVAVGSGITLKGSSFSLAWAELWRGNPPDNGKVELRKDVALLSATASFDEVGKAGLANVQIVPPGLSKENYTATLDVYNTPWGAHPTGHYGYWSLPVAAGSGADLQWRLDLARKQMTTKLNGGDAPNYPPDPKDLDLTRYGNLGDFRASLNLYAGGKLVGSTKLFDFAVWAQGDKNRLENRRAGAFKGYNTTLAFLVLPPG